MIDGLEAARAALDLGGLGPVRMGKVVERRDGRLLLGIALRAGEFISAVFQGEQVFAARGVATITEGITLLSVDKTLIG